MQDQITRRTLLASAAALVLASAGPASLAEDRIGVRGEIREAEARKDGSLRLLVVGRKQSDTQVDRASVRVTPKTRVFRLKDGKRIAEPQHRLQKGTRVQVRFSGPVMESYPVQATAGEILILR